MRVHIRHAKGNKDRWAVLPEVTLKVLRHYWKTHRHPQFLFPSKPPRPNSFAPVVINKGTTQRAFAKIVKECGIQKTVSIHNLHHSYATHLIEANMNLSGVQELLGHECPKTTSMYSE